ncbi:transcriptional repressor [Alteromonas sp. BL110]|uniref:Fur family transcriptional regulator n=1 Tax=Alteromonas sp. BL110 TaxID=1714845 RepID=UPI000E5351E3|nr:transcriptional repressor [Alteromonas sp. BL110]AXT40879.1 transcriptional repressor [Alteromonas sp. BL110]RKM81031.1 transcriptional repressor [Alteromonas sp. BL110]
MDQRFQNLLAIAQDKCEEDGLRLTQKRKQVLNILIEASSPLSAYEIKDLCAKQHNENIKPMTIYRALEFLSEANLVHKLNLNNKYIGCARAKCCEHHGYSQFLICVRCGAVEESIVEPVVYEHLVQQAQAFKCEIITPHLEVACICARCQ